MKDLMILIVSVLMILAVITLAFFDNTNRELLKYKLLCINGVEYVNTKSGVTASYDKHGDFRYCDDETPK